MAPRPIQTRTSQPVLAQKTQGPSVASAMGPLPLPNMAPVVSHAAAWGQLREGAEELLDFSMNLMKPEIAARGAQAVTRDPSTGELTVELRTPLNHLDEAYNHAAKTAFAAESENDRRLRLQQLAQDNIDDPDKFRALASDYVKAQAGGAGVPTELRADLVATGMNDVVQITGGLVSQKRARDVKIQLNSLKSGINSTKNDIFALAHQGGTDTPAFKEAVGKLRNQMGQLANPVFGVGQEEVQQDINETISAAEAESALGHALAFAKERGAKAGLDFLDKAVWDTELNLSPAQRQAFYNRGRAEIREWDAEQRDARMEQRQAVEQSLDDARAKAEATGDWTSVVSPNEIARAYADNPSKAADIVSDLNGRANIHSMRKQVMNATPQDLAAMDAQLNPSGSAPSAGIDEATARAAVMEAFPGSTVTSGKRTPEKNAQVGGVPNSQHLAANAVDFVLPKGRTFQEVKTALAAKGLPVSELIDEGDHVHWAWGEKGGQGFADRQRTYQAFQQAVLDRNTALNKDPMAFVAAARTDISTLLQSQDPMTFQTGVRNSMIAQREMGIASPRVMSGGQVSNIVQSFNNPPDPAKRADHMLSIIGGVEKQYGRYFPQAMAELQQKGMPSEAVALAQVKDDPAVAWRFANAVNTGRAALRKAVGQTDEIDKAVVSSLGAFNKTLVGQMGNARVAAQQIEAAQLYAYQLKSEGISNPGQRAVQDIIGKNYTFANTYRVPAAVDASKVGAGVRQVLTELGPKTIRPLESFDPSLNAETRQKMSSQILHGRGVWLTLPDESGLYLAYPQETGFVPGRRTDGQPIAYSWSQLTSAAARRVPNVPVK